MSRDRKIIEHESELDQPDREDTSAGSPPDVDPEGVDLPPSAATGLDGGEVE